MKKLVVAVALAMVVGGIPAVGAEHMSVGMTDSIGDDAEETPANKSVNVSEYEIGTSRDCYDVDTDNQTMDEFDKARGSDAFCGKLIYHEDTPFEHVSDPDQSINAPEIGEFDVVRVGQPLIYIGWCAPFCTGTPGGDTLFETVHDAGALVDLTENSSEADSNAGDRYQIYGLDGPSFPAASNVIQNQHATWRMNGWHNPQPTFENFVGFLYDNEGDPIGEQRLEEIFATHRDKFDADRSVQPSVCGFTPEADIGIGAGQAGMCEVNFYYAESRGDQTSFQDGYNDRCSSPTYVCGAFASAWRGILFCWADNPCSGYGSSTASVSTGSPVNTMRNSAMEFDYTRWHWAVAPTQSACNGLQEPGMAFNNPNSADWNYLAHDLDVWTRVTDARDVDGTEGMDATRDWTVEQPFNVYENVTDAVSERTDEVVENVTDEVNDLADEVPGLPPIPEAPTEVPDRTKPHQVEPNAHTDEFTELSEDSQTIALDRAGPEGEVDPCTEFFQGGGDGEEHVDPWVNIVDMDTMWKDTGAGGVCSSSSGLCGGVYGNNDADHQDHTNAPTQGFVYFQGKTGVFTDKNDDGDYDQAANNNLWDDVEAVGAYPMLWDMRLDQQTGEPDTEAGCTFGFSDTPLTQEMVGANYGAHTGLVMAVYLEEASAIMRSENIVSYPDGQNIFILESQAMHTLRNIEDDRVLDFEQRIIDGLQSHPSIADEPDIVYANDVMGVNNAFSDQCSEATGGFDTTISLLHNCEVSCEGDTIVTGFMGESTREDNVIGSLGGDGNVPTLEIGDQNFAFPTSIVEWIDVDPFDNNPDRNREESSAPPS